MDPYIGEIRLLPFTFAPMDWLPCDGRSLPISGEYQTLYAVIGTTYGGSGQNFNLPDLRAFIPVGPNRSVPTTVQLDIGEPVGESTVKLTVNQLPSHGHTMVAKTTATAANRLTTPATDAQPGQVLFNGTTSTPTTQKAFSSLNTPDAAFSQQAIGISGFSTEHSNQQPYLPLNFMIAYSGIYPAPG